MRVCSPDSRSTLGWTLALTSLAFFMLGLDALVVVTALPAIIAGFRPSFTLVAGLALVGGLAAFGVGDEHKVARASSSLRPAASAAMQRQGGAR
jgi:hypothetical protein